MERDDNNRSVLLIGVPDSGKTNFLMRLWLALEAGDGLLTKAGLPADLDYLKTGTDHLLRGEFAPHTPQDVQDRTEIPVKTSRSGIQFNGTLIVPDLPGEQILSVFQNREWSNDWEDQIRAGLGCLLLVRVDSSEFVAPLDWMGCAAYFGSPFQQAKAPTDATGKVKPPTQVVMTDWLQFMRRAFTDRVGGAYRPRIGILIAAWDLAPQDQKAAGPEAWVASNLPLLHQYVRSNDDRFDFSYFGVSVTSGDLEADQEFKASYLKGDPRKAGQVVHTLSGAIEASVDFTLPVAWALGVADAVKPEGFDES